MTESMIERVAKAIQGELPEFTGVTPEYLQALYKNAAEAAIEAMREPTDLMIEAGGEAIFGWNGDKTPATEAEAQVAWPAMIDAALQWPAGSADRAGVPMAED